HDPLHVAEVLDVDRLVESVLSLDLGDGLPGRALAEQRLRRPAREGPDPDEEQDREPEEDRDEQEQPTDDEAQHLAPRHVVRRLGPTRCYSPPSSPIVTGAKDSFVVGLGWYPCTS